METISRGVQRARQAGPRRFSLIEVVLALVVITFGLISVLALLPANLRATRDSVADTHSSQVGEHLIQVLSTAIEDAPDDATWAAKALALPTTKPDAAEPGEGWTRWLSQEGVTYWRAGDDQQLVRVDMRRAGADYSEFSAICRIWRQPVTISSYEDGAWSTRTLPDSVAIGLQVEVSWPAQAPYSGRQKSLFALNVFRKAS